MKKYGDHIIAEFIGVNAVLIEDIDYVRSAFYDLAKVLNLTLLTFHWHKFDPHGISLLLILQESHISMHTWPEDQYCAVDIFTCGEHVEPQKLLEYLVNLFQLKNVISKHIDRGIPTVFGTKHFGTINVLQYETFNK